MNEDILRGIGHALLALRWELRAQQRRLIKDDGDANYCEKRADTEALAAEAKLAS